MGVTGAAGHIAVIIEGPRHRAATLERSQIGNLVLRRRELKREREQQDNTEPSDDAIHKPFRPVYIVKLTVDVTPADTAVDLLWLV
jgi:hypothetical protein